MATSKDLHNESFSSNSPPPSPLEESMFRKRATTKVKDSSQKIIGLRDEDMAIDELDADETMTLGDEEQESSAGDSVDDEDDEAAESPKASDDEDWVPSKDVSPATVVKNTNRASSMAGLQKAIDK